MNFRVKKAVDRGALFSVNKKRMAGLDGGYSIPLNNGQCLWFFGDTLIGERVAGQSLWYEFGLGEGEVNMSGWGSFDLMLNNTGILVPEGAGFSGTEAFSFIIDDNAEIRQLIHNLPEEAPQDYRIWCLDGCTIGETVYLYYLKILMIPDQPVLDNFKVVGAGLAKGDRTELKFSRVGEGDYRLFWSKGMPGYGSAVYHDTKGGWVYLYGSLKSDNGEQNCFLSRVRIDEIEDLQAYRYWTGDEGSWSSEPKKAEPVFGGMPNEMSVSWNSYLGCYFSVHSLGLTGDVVARTAEHPWGPWSSPELLWRVDPLFPATDKFSPLVYAGKEHPEMTPDNGKTVFLTFIEFEEYFPHLVEIELEKN